ncbi:MAG: InlB B-repeat-containing protein [Firmicutes bacterium]|nr:InlB B-repeat-containing protein [Bacillota bacterium]
MKKRLSFIFLGLLSALTLASCNSLSSLSLSGLTSGSSESTTSQTSSSSSASVSSSESSSSSSSIVVTHTIAFEENGGSTVADITQQVGSSVSAPTAPSKTGYTFVGWYSDSSLTTAYTFTVMPNQDITLYAKWQINQYTITFVTNGGSSVAAILADYNAAVSAPTAPTKTGYTFAGWFSDSALTTPYTFSTMPLGGTTVYAKWDVKEYTITFNSNGGSDVSPITQAFNSVVSEPVPPTKTGFSFIGWFTNEALTNAYVFSTMPAENLTLFAKWVINQYTITFAVDGGSSVTAITQNYDTTVIAPENPSKLGFIFTGWYIDNQYSALYSFDKMPSENITVYAKWEVDPLYGTISIQEFKDTTDGAYHEVAGVVLFGGGTEMGIIVITDSTGILVVMSTGVAKNGDFIKVGGSLGYMDTFPIMGAADPATTLLMILDYERPIPIDPTPITIAAYNALDPNESDNWINYLEITGTLTVNPTEHSMNLVDGADTLPLLVMSQEIYNFLMQYEGFRITVRGIDLPNFDAEPILMFVFTGNPTDIVLAYTDAELVAVLGPMLVDYLSTQNFFPGQYPELPTTHPVAPALTVTYETFGPNAALYDVTKGQFSTLIDSAVSIDIRATITLGAIVSTVEFQLHVAPLNFTTVADFLLVPDAVQGGENTYYYLKGTVIHLQFENNFVMMADATGIVYILTSDTTIQVGDEIVAYGVKMTSHGMILMASEKGETVLAILSSGNPMPLTRTPIALADFLALDINDPANSLVYFSVTGQLSLASAENMVYVISDGVSNVPVLASNAADFAALQPYVGMVVTVSGLSTPIPEQSMMLLVFINYPGDVVIPS